MTPHRPAPSLSPSEWLVVQALRRLDGRATLPAVCAALPPHGQLPRESVRALLDRLYRRGLLLRDGTGPAWGPLALDYEVMIRQTVESLLSHPVFEDPQAVDLLRNCLEVRCLRQPSQVR